MEEYAQLRQRKAKGVPLFLEDPADLVDLPEDEAEEPVGAPGEPAEILEIVGEPQGSGPDEGDEDLDDPAADVA